MFVRIAAVTALAAGFMALIADGRLVERFGLVGRCSEVSGPAIAGGSWQACRPGKLEGRPSLARQSCVSQGVRGEVEYWRCPAQIVVSAKPKG